MLKKLILRKSSFFFLMGVISNKDLDCQLIGLPLSSKAHGSRLREVLSRGIHGSGQAKAYQAYPREAKVQAQASVVLSFCRWSVES